MNELEEPEPDILSQPRWMFSEKNQVKVGPFDRKNQNFPKKNMFHRSKMVILDILTFFSYETIKFYNIKWFLSYTRKRMFLFKIRFQWNSYNFISVYDILFKLFYENFQARIISFI